MALLKPVIHCIVDTEPRLFHKEADKTAFAVNLSFEVLSDGVPGDIKSDEPAAEKLYLAFLTAVQSVQFRLYDVTDPDPEATKLTYLKAVTSVSESTPLGHPGDLHKWLIKEGQDTVSAGKRYWTSTKPPGPSAEWPPDLPVDSAIAAATHRLRAAQSWNAPVAHKFWLTHILRLDRADVDDRALAILPHFSKTVDKTEFSGGALDPKAELNEDAGFDFDYDAQGSIGPAVCRTNLIGKGISSELDPFVVDRGLTSGGYLKVDPDGENVRRLLKWLEDGAASLMAANPALNLPDTAETETRFGLQFPDPAGGTPQILWGSLVWYATARLVSALDNIVIALLKPVLNDDFVKETRLSFDNNSEGEVLSPLVSQVLDQLELIESPSKLDARALQASKVTSAIREALREASPLVAGPTGSAEKNAKLVKALTHIYQLPNATEILDGTAFISAMLKNYAENGPAQVPASAFAYASSLKGRSVVAVAQALLDIEQSVQGEAGVEQAIVRIFESTESPAKKTITAFIAEKYMKEIGQSGSDLEAAVKGAVDQAWLAYRAALDGPFNGAEASRRAVSSSFVRSLLTYSTLRATKPLYQGQSVYLGDLCRKSAFLSRRFFGLDPRAKCFDPLILALVMPEIDRLTSEQVTEIKEHFEDALAEALAPLQPMAERDRRFVPDSAPQPLTVQIAANIDGSKVDIFAKRFNGIAVAMRRKDKGDDSDLWAHAHLADFTWKTDYDGSGTINAVQAGLHPMLPAVTDGRGAMFIEYEGFPFADQLSGDRIPEGQGDVHHGTPFYNHEPHTPDAFAAVPRLAYGRHFETFGFITSNAGTLPLALQSSPPWMPNAKIAAPEITVGSEVLIGRTAYQRRTAIAQMAIEETVAPGNSRRIGAQIEGVFPLASDYPRTGLLAQVGAPGVRDIQRESDRRGMIAISAGGTTEWRLSDIRCSGKAKSLTIRFFDRHAYDPGDQGAATIVIPGSELSSASEIALSITVGGGSPLFSANCNKKTYNTPLSLSGGTSGWLRLLLETDDAAASMTFADIGAQKTDGIAAPLLLLAPDMKDIWTAGSTGVAVGVSTPRVSYLDFERWFANQDRYEETFKGQLAAAGILMRALLTAYVMRHLHGKMAALLDRLPDPAVEEIRIELIATDQLTNKSAGAIAGKEHSVKDILREFAKTIEEPKDEKGRKAPWTPSLLYALLSDLDRLFKFGLRIEASKAALALDIDKTGYVASVPPGTIARLSLDARVPAKHFDAAKAIYPAVFHSGLKQYAAYVVGKSLLGFPAAAIRIETMYDGMAELAAEDDKGNPKEAIGLTDTMIRAEPVGRSRRFDIITGDPAAIQGKDADEIKRRISMWRLIGEIDVTTQRWRSTGRPIYHHVSPRDHRDKRQNAGGSAALPLILDGKGSLAQFEQEAFFDRPHIDAHSITQRLDPLPARTKLQEHYWNSPSATYFRHRFTLRTRYAGALLAIDKREVNAWPRYRPTTAHAWTMRVAMLAELTRDELTRPQLRALLPLTTAPGSDTTRPAPPVAAILQEPPFARAGLADRVAGEIKLGFGYGFVAAEKPVEIMDARREAGLTPFLGYRPLSNDNALSFALLSEGPMGLTFDDIDAPGAAFPNSILALTPHAQFGGEPPREELMGAIAMRRYIDPNWTNAESLPAQSLDAELCWWMDGLIQASSDNETLLDYIADGKPAALLSIPKPKAEILEILASKLAIDGVAGAKDNQVCILRVNRASFASLTLLHQPVAPGRYSTSIFLSPHAGDTAEGRIGLPIMMASFEWSPPKSGPEGQEKRPSVVLLKGKEGAHAYPTMASAPTALKWAHTSRDFDLLHSAAANDSTWIDNTTHANDLVASLSENNAKLTISRSGSAEVLWLCSSTFLNPYPLHLHRHLAVITSRFVEELGRPLEVFCRTSQASGSAFALTTFDGKTKAAAVGLEHCARIVELETPAAILTHYDEKDATIPDRYKTAYFDLVATGFKLAQDVGCLRLYFRFVGSPMHVRKFKSIKLSLWQTDRPGKPIEIELKHSDKTFTAGLCLTLSRAGSSATDVDVKLLRSDGELVQHTVPPAQKPPITLMAADPVKAAGFFVSLQVPGGGEFWCDVSLLHSANNYALSPLDFNWLFSQSDESDPASKVGARGLNEMVEAQARIVSVSPPIPIVTG